MEWAESFFNHGMLPNNWTRPDTALDLKTVNRVAQTVRDQMARIRGTIADPKTK